MGEFAKHHIRLVTYTPREDGYALIVGPASR